MINANIHALEDIKIDGKEGVTTSIKGLLVSEKKFESKKHITLTYADNCGTACPPVRSLKQKPLSLIKNATVTNFDVYPNPAFDVIYVSCDEAITELVIFDNVGKLVRNVPVLGDLQNVKVHLNLDAISGGVYSIHVRSNRSTHKKKLS